jgi:hypothetical protein
MRMARNISGVVALAACGLLLSCGDPVPPAAQGSLSIHLSQPNDPDDPKASCSPSIHWVNVPYPRKKTQVQQTTELDPKVKAVNGQDGNTVSCSVAPNGSDFKVSIDASAYAEDDDGKKLAPTHVHITIPKIAKGQSGASGSFSFQDNFSSTTYSSQPNLPCSFSVQSMGDSDSFGIEEGKIWGRMTCASVPDPKSPGSSCGVDTGFFVFENCSK